MKSLENNDTNLNSLYHSDEKSIIQTTQVDLKCGRYSLRVGFNKTELDAQFLSYSIKFVGNNTCGKVNANSANHIKDGKIWIASNYTDCGIEAYHEGDQIAFEQTILVEYGSRSESALVYRYFNTSYKIKCLLDRNVTTQLQINVKDRKDELQTGLFVLKTSSHVVWHNKDT